MIHLRLRSSYRKSAVMIKNITIPLPIFVTQSIARSNPSERRFEIPPTIPLSRAGKRNKRNIRKRDAHTDIRSLLFVLLIFSLKGTYLNILFRGCLCAEKKRWGKEKNRARSWQHGAGSAGRGALEGI